jgi:PST family polysaccharide transporter
MTGAGLVSGVGLLVVLVPWGLPGVGLAVSGGALVVALTGLAMVRTVVGVSGRELTGRMLPAAAAAVVALLAVGLLERTVVHADTWSVPVGLGLVAAEALLLGAIYLAALHVVAPGLARTVRDAARAWGRRGKKT